MKETFKYERYSIGITDAIGRYYVIRLYEINGYDWFSLSKADTEELDSLFFLDNMIFYDSHLNYVVLQVTT